MKIAFIIRALTIGGAQRQLIGLANQLASAGHAISIIVFYSCGEWVAEISPEIGFFNLAKKDRLDVITPGIRLYRAIEDIDPEAIYSFLPSSNIISALIKLYRPRTVVLWGRRSANKRAYALDGLERMISRAERFLARIPDAIIYNSFEGERAGREDGFPPGKSHVLLNGLDPDQFYPDPALRNSQRNEWCIGADQSVVGIVGRLDPIKDHRTFLRVAAAIKRARPDARFVVIGDGTQSYKSELLEFAADLGLSEDVLWTGHRTDMNRAYNGLDVLLSVSAGESFSNAILEAMACGVPCVVTDVGDSARIVRSAWQVAKPGSVEELSRAVVLLLDNPRMIDKDQLVLDVANNYSLEAATGAFLHLLDSVRKDRQK